MEHLWWRLVDLVLIAGLGSQSFGVRETSETLMVWLRRVPEVATKDLEVEWRLCRAKERIAGQDWRSNCSYWRSIWDITLREKIRDTRDR